MNKLLSMALLVGMIFAAACSSDSSGGTGSNGAAATGCQALADCCNSGDDAFKSSCNSGLTQANNNDEVCTGVLGGLKNSGKCGGTGAAGSGQAGSGQAGSGQAGEGNAGSGGNGQAGEGSAGNAGAGGVVAMGAECMTLEACCMTLTAGVKDGCDHVVGLNNPGSCTMLLATYKNAGQCQPAAAKMPFSCDTPAKHQCFQEQADSATYMTLTQYGCMDGTIGTMCPTTGLIGCCALAAAAASVCNYTEEGGQTADELSMSCTAMGGTWSTTP